MKERRSASQVLFGFLPEQTVDMRGGVWKVRRWHTQSVRDVDDEALRAALVTKAAAWEANGLDGGYVKKLRGKWNLRVEALDREKGVIVEPFPATWKCNRCHRLHDGPTKPCKCGSSRHGQLAFVLYHDACGTVRQPHYPRCRVHGEVRMRLPGTTSLREIRLDCPTCSQPLGSSFLFVKCSCGESGQKGESMEFTVHRGASVYTPRNIVIVNPPSRAQSHRLAQAGGPGSAAIWVADGMTARWVDAIEGGRAAGLRRTLKESGLDDAAVDRMVAASGLDDRGPAPVPGAPEVVRLFEEEAASIALATSETRQTLADLRVHATGELAELYAKAYPAALASAGLDRVDLVERFPVLTGQYGYTRGNHEPGVTRLIPFSAGDGACVVYGEVATTEALLLRLKPTLVAKWLRRRGFPIAPADEERAAHEAILGAMRSNPDDCAVFGAVRKLIHSFSHRMVRHASFYAGIDRNSLSELLFPRSLAFVTFARAQGDFVLGGLQALFEYDLHTVLDRVVFDERRCALDPGCGSNPSGAACAVCLHLGEPSCQLFNTELDRRTLFESDGYFDTLS